MRKGKNLLYNTVSEWTGSRKIREVWLLRKAPGAAVSIKPAHNEA